MSTKPADGTASLDKALDVLDAVGQSAHGLSQVELGERLGLPRTTLYRLLGTLVARGLLRRDPLRRVYCLGMRCFEYARTAYAMPDLVAAAGAELRALRDISGETTYLAALDGLEVVSLERCDGAHPHRSHAALGQRKPLHCTSQGKAILAALPAEQREALVRDVPLEAQTPRTITDRRRLHAELRLTAQRGYSIDDEEIALGVRCCGAAIVDNQGHVRGAISVAGPAFRLGIERVHLLGAEVAEAARRIGAQISATHPGRNEGEIRPVPGPWAFEGAFPVWCGSQLIWADTLAPALHSAGPTGDKVLATLDEPIAALLPWAAGVAVLSGNQWRAFDLRGAVLEPPPWPRRRMLAAALGPRGELCGCVPDGERWRVGPLVDDALPAGGVRVGEAVSAMAWNAHAQAWVLAAADSGTLYLAAEGSGSVRRLATVPKGSGRLAGLAVDSRGGVWTALRGGWSVARFDEDGAMDLVLPLAVPAPSGVAIGGEDGSTLYVTSARDALDRESLDAAPLSGRLFAQRID